MNSALFSKQLVRWFLDNKRDLPWRRTKNPYYIWISEVMLQQTQVDTVIPYYKSFIEKYPTPEDLALADEEQVLKQWEGLGYYSRARNLQKGVREVVENYNGKIPENRKEILAIKGIGPYTAGAVLSIAFNQPEPAVDGNVMRVISRVFLIDDDISKAKTRKKFEEILYSLIPDDAASSFNQGLMELGALICRPKQPKCSECPLKNLCQGYAEGVPLEYPVKSKKIKSQTYYYKVIVLENMDNKILIHKREGTGLLANLYEFPMLPTDEKENISAIHKLIDPQSVKNADIHVTHTFSHLKWDLNVCTARIKNETSLPDESYRWVSEEEIEQLPIPVPHQKIWRAFNKIIKN